MEYKEDPKQSTYKLPGLTGEFGKVATTKSSIQSPPAQTSTDVYDNVFKVSLRRLFKIKVYKDSLNKKEPLLENL